MGARRDELASIDRLTRRFLAVMQEAHAAMNYRVVGDLALVLELLEGRREQLARKKKPVPPPVPPRPIAHRRRSWWSW